LAVAYLLIGELGDGPFLDFLNNLGDAPPFWSFFGGRRLGYLAVQSRYTFFVCPKKKSNFLGIAPPPFGKS